MGHPCPVCEGQPGCCQRSGWCAVSLPTCAAMCAMPPPHLQAIAAGSGTAEAAAQALSQVAASQGCNAVATSLARECLARVLIIQRVKLHGPPAAGASPAPSDLGLMPPSTTAEAQAISQLLNPGALANALASAGESSGMWRSQACTW
jgi:hypothetical protein